MVDSEMVDSEMSEFDMSLQFFKYEPVSAKPVSAKPVTARLLIAKPVFANPIMAKPIIANRQSKQSIPKHVKTIVWNNYIGEDIIKHRCLCCKKVLIKITDFHVGHIISEKDGGTHEINNLRPICAACNHSMGTMNMIEFIKTYGLYI